MVELLKNWMGINKKEDEKEIPEIHLHKNEPKYYFDEKLKRWVFEGEEIEQEKTKKPPPKGLNNKNKDQKTKDKKNNKEIKSKYPSMFGEENIYKPEIKSNNDNNPNIIQNDINMQPESENINKKEENNDNKNDLEDIKEKEDDLKLNDNNNKEEDKLENSPEKINDDNLNLNIHNNNNDYNDNQFINGSNFKLLNSIKKLETQSELSEISLHKEDFSTLYQKELNDYKKNILEEEI